VKPELSRTSNLLRAKIPGNFVFGVEAMGENAARIIRFGAFEADLHEGRLTKAGVRIRLQEQPFQILALLLDRPGQLVTREEIRQKLWTRDTFVEFDDALNTAVRKLRAALNDSADNPRFLETVPRRGYRFLAPVFVAPVVVPPAPQIGPSAVGVTWPASSSAPEATPVAAIPPASSARPRWRTPTIISSVALLAVIAVGIRRYVQRPGFRISPADTLVLADFVNTTGENVFDDALRQALQVGLAQSPAIQVLPDRKAAVILRQMGHLPEQRMVGKTALEVCQRTGSKVTVQGSIASLGTTYLIGLAAIRCDTGVPIANEQVQARQKEDVVDALGQATSHLRARLGESLPSLQKHNAPLEQATTPSLDALNAYGTALSTWDKKGDRACLPFLQRALDLDPNFAMAYGAMATIYYNLGENDLARQNATKAYELKDRVTEAERLAIESRYYLYVTGELDKALQVYEYAVEDYPPAAGALNHLGTTAAKLGRLDQGVSSLRAALALDPTRATTYSNLASDLLALNRMDEAAATLAEADKRRFQTDYLLQVSYWHAFLRNDRAEMERILVQSSTVQGAQSLLLTQQANTEAYFGHLEKAGELAVVAANLMQHDADKESAATCLAEAAVREAEVGNAARARSFIAQAQNLFRGDEVVTLAALVAAENGDFKQAEALSRDLDKQWPQGTFVQRYWLPVIRAEIDLHQHQALKAVLDLDLASPLEYGGPSGLSVSSMHPVYVRGNAYLAAGDAKKAAVEFQKFVDHPGVVLNFPLASLARLGLARAYARGGDSAKARAAYQDFLHLWKDADSDLSILKKAKSEYANLR
jgi:DNA-binding winged helix-turn-helix (wHTH) protein/Tfp pilus assembly protein PilF